MVATRTLHNRDTQMKTCTGCEAEMAAEAKNGPHCGADQSIWFGRRRKLIATTFLLCMPLLGLAGVFYLLRPTDSTVRGASLISFGLGLALAVLVMLARQAGEETWRAQKFQHTHWRAVDRHRAAGAALCCGAERRLVDGRKRRLRAGRRCGAALLRPSG